MLGSSVPGMGLVGSVLGVPPWNVDSLAMTHLTGEVQQIWAVLVGNNAVNVVLSGRRTVILRMFSQLEPAFETDRLGEIDRLMAIIGSLRPGFKNRSE